MEPIGTSVKIRLPEFEGPLDLLLHLCKTHELDILNIPISFITDKYLEYLDVMQSLSVDVAADYLVMAATLAYLKSRELVPAPEPLEGGEEDEESGLDPRQELIRRLLEYQKYKDAAERLGGRPIEGRTVFTRGSAVESAVEPELADHSAWRLIGALSRILEKGGTAAEQFSHEVVIDRMSVRQRISNLIDRLEAGGGVFRFEDCFDLSLPVVELKHQVVVTLLGVLELTRLKLVRVLQPSSEEGLMIVKLEGVDLAKGRNIEVTSVSGEDDAPQEDQQPAVTQGASAPVAATEENTDPDEEPGQPEPGGDTNDEDHD